MTKLKKGKKVGPWKLVEKLGEGGNGFVWQVKKVGLKGFVALKILKPDVPQAHYSRFRDEVKILSELHQFEGIVPLLDFSLPEDRKTEDAWLSMPIATPIKEKLDDSSVREIVKAVVDISAVLSSLHSMDIFHRDIKPDNLFWYKDFYAIGDFGLATYQGKVRHTAKSKRLGPIMFMPSEMMISPFDAEPGASDVYCLAKTLWVLLTGQMFPPLGQLISGREGLDLGTYYLGGSKGYCRLFKERFNQFLVSSDTL